MAPVARICLIGAESTGKSRLADDLAKRFDAVVVPEFAREYAIRVARPLDEADVEPIARGQIANEDRAPANALLILDTDLLSTVVYTRYYWGRCPEWIEHAARARLADLYLFLHADVPWVEDSARDAAADRERVHAEFHRALDEFKARYVSITGNWSEREAKAIAAVSRAATLIP